MAVLEDLEVSDWYRAYPCDRDYRYDSQYPRKFPSANRKWQLLLHRAGPLDHCLGELEFL
jgi:hypothetical protein